MKTQKFTKTLTATAILSCAFLAESARAEIFENISCGENCTVTYDTASQTVTMTGEGVISAAWRYNLGEILDKNHYPRVVKNVNIGEGFTSGENYAFNYNYNYTHGLSIGTSDGTIKIPGTWRGNRGDNSTYSVGFGTFEIAPTNSETPVNLSFGMPNAQKIVLTPDTNTRVKIDAAYGSYPASVDIQCRGNKNTCAQMVTRGSNTTALTTSYYSGPDGNGNWEEWSDNGKAIYADSTKAKPLATYGFDGKQTASYNYSANGLLLSANTYDAEGNVVGSYNYTYDAGGNLVSAYQNGKAVYLRKRYTIPEADAATQGKGPFRLDITW